jgi:tetratricopeptide (TPR) repeat protein
MRICFWAYCFLIHSVAFTQITNTRYKEVDSLIESRSILDNKAALQLLETTLVMDSTTVDYWLVYAKACDRLMKSEKALASIEKAIAINPKSDYAYFKKAQFYYESEGDVASALENAAIAISLSPQGEYYFYRGIYYQLLQQEDKAFLDYEKALELGYEYEGLYRNYAILLFKKEQPQKALEAIQKGIMLEPNVADNYITLGETYAFLMDIDKMCSAIELAYSKGYRDKNDIYTLVCNNKVEKNKFTLLGDVFTIMNKYTFALQAYNKALEIEPNASSLVMNIGSCYHHLNEYEKAETYYLKSLDLPKPDKELIYNNMCILYFDENKFDKTIAYANKRIVLNPKNYTAYIDRGGAYRKLKNYKNAEADFNKALAIKPDFFRAFGYRGYLYLEMAQYVKALEDAKKAIAINPEYGYGYLILGQAKISLKRGDYCNDFLNAQKYGEPDAEAVINLYCK